MAIVDILGREVKVGDIVVSTNNSSSYTQIHVVTRLGSVDRVQVNGCSYVMAEYMMVCTEQYTIAKGAKAAEELIELNRIYFEEKQVEKKKPSPKFYILKYSAYKPNPAEPRYFVLTVQGNSQEIYKQIKDFFSDIDLKELGDYCNKETLNSRNRWVYGDIGQAKTMKEMKALGLARYLNQEITKDMDEYAQLNNF